MADVLKILMLEDVATDAELALRELRRAGLTVTSQRVETEADFECALTEYAPDLILADYSLPQFDGLSAVRLVVARCPQVPIIIVSATLGEELAIESLKLGATDYVIKQRLERLGPVARRALQEAAERRERQRAEEQNHYLASVLENVSDGVISTEAQGNILSWNSGAEAMFGYTAAEVVGRPYGEVVSYDFMPGAEPETNPAVGESGRWKGELRVRHKDGRLIYVLLAGAMLKNSAGQVTGFSAVLHDITERKAAEAVLVKSEHRHRSLFENMLDGYAYCQMLVGADASLDFVILECNEAFGRLTGLGQVIGQRVSEAIPGIRESNPQMFETYARVAASGRPEKFELYAEPLKRWFSVSVYSPETGFFVPIFENITERKQAQAQVEFQAHLLAHINDAVIATDAQFHVNAWNHAAEALYGWTPEEALGRGVGELLRSEFSEAQRDEAVRRLKVEGANRLEVVQHHKDGHVLYIEGSTITLANDAGVVTGYVSANRDIAERKQAEQALAQNMDLLSRAEQIGHIGSWSWDIAANKVVWSDGLYSIFGLERQAFAGTAAAYLARVHPDDQARARQLLEMALRQPGGLAFESRIVLPDGAIRVIDSRAEVARDAHDNPTRLVGLAIDITERKQAEAAMAASEVELHALFAAMTDVVLVLDSEGRYLQIAPTSPALLVKPPQELLGRTIHEMLPAVEAEIIQQHITAALEKLAPTQVSYSLLVGEARVWFDATIAPLSGDRVIWMARDVTPRVQREREREAIAAVSSALRAASTRASMLPIVLGQVTALLNADAAALATRDPASDDLVVLLGQGEMADLAGRRLPAGAGIAGQAVTNGRPYVTDDIAADPHFHQLKWLGAVRAAVCVPLITSQQVMGVLWAKRAEPFSDEEVRVLSAIAGLAASALQRAALYEQTEQRLQRLAALREIDSTIMNSMDLRTTLFILLAQVNDQLGVDASDILLLSRGMNVLEYAAGRGFRTKAIEQTRQRLGEGHAGQAALERRMMRESNLGAPLSVFRRGALLAAEEFMAMVCVPLVAKGQVVGVLEVFKRAPLEADADWLGFLETLAGQAAIATADAWLFNDLQRSNMEMLMAYDSTLEGWSAALDLRDKETEGHSQRVTEMALELARALGVSDANLEQLRRGALLHDIGKMSIPDKILLKPGKLTDDEWVIMRQHPRVAFELLSPIAYLRPALDIPYCHHEKWDGSGYPRHLKGDEIPLAARIFAVVDVWDALRSDRPYRAGWTVEAVRAYLQDAAGKHFEPRIVQAFLALRQPES